MLSKGSWSSFSKVAARYTQGQTPVPFIDFMMIKAVGANFGVWLFFPLAQLLKDDDSDKGIVYLELGRGQLFAFASGAVNMLMAPLDPLPLTWV